MTQGPVRIVLSADDNYARPLAVTARSAIGNLIEGRSLEIYVLDNGISAAHRAVLERSLDHANTEVRWIEGLADRVAGLPTHGFFTTAVYGRLLIPELLPPSVDRVIYLDCDLVVRQSLDTLYDLPIDGVAARAVPDMGAPFVSSSYGLPLWFEQHRQASDYNFNTGVMLINLDYWRAENIGQRALEYLQSDMYQHVMVDQEALNAVVGTKIELLDPHWNQQAEIYKRPCALALPYDRELIASVQDDPWIVHYSTADKPWSRRGTQHPWVKEWFHYLDATAFSGLRLRKRPSFIGWARSAKRTAVGQFKRSGWV